MKEPRTGAPPQPHGRGHILAPAYLWVAGLQGWRALTFCAALGAISNLAFPPFHIWPALALGLSGLIWMLDSARLMERPRRAALWRVGRSAVGAVPERGCRLPPDQPDRARLAHHGGVRRTRSRR